MLTSMEPLMDRANSSWTPPEIAERAADRGEQEYSPADLAEARTEIEDAILETQKGWKGHTLFGALQHFLNEDAPLYDVKLGEVAKHLQHILEGNPEDKGVPFCDRLALARMDARTWLRGIVAEYIEDDWVNERATEIAGERLELAS